MIPYSPVSLKPLLGQLTPQKPQAPVGIPSWGVNLLIIGTGIALGIGAYPYRKKPVGDLLVHAGGGMAGIGFIFAILDLAGFRPTSQL